MSDHASPGTFLHPVGAELARVLAQAANSAYAPATFYVVARYHPVHEATAQDPFNVQKPVPTYAEAVAVVAELEMRDPGAEYGIFGPFQNDSQPRASQATVAQLVVTPQEGAVPLKPFTIPGQEFDAIFYSVPAVEKFVVPYYVQEYGLAFGRRILREFRAGPLALMGHLPWSEEAEIQVVGVAGGHAAPASNARAGARFPSLPVLMAVGDDGALQRRTLYPTDEGPE
jgi:hypothetical protein